MNSKPGLLMEDQKRETTSLELTVLHLSLTGFDEYTHALGPEAGSALLQEGFRLFRHTVELYEGKVEKYLGEQLIALFGVDGAHDQAPSHALGAAREIQQKFADFKEERELPPDLGLRAGIFAGPVMAGSIGPDDDSQVNYFGEAINIARHIQAMAEPGQVLVGDSLYLAARDKFQFNALEPVPLKGLRKPLPLYELLGRKETTGKVPLQSGRMISSRMIGREAELKLLEKQVLQLINGRGSVVNIEGIAGIGKSRLMAEIRQKDLIENVAFFQGRALSEGSNLSFHPITHIIRSWAGITENDPAPRAAEKLRASIRGIMPGSEGEVFPFIATMMGFYLDGKDQERLEGIEGEALERLILKNLRDLIAKAASLRPVVIVIEDAHWADQSSVLFLETLYKLVRNNRLLFVNVFRPGHKNTGERIEKYTRENLPDHSMEIGLEPLTKEQTEELIANLLQQTKLPDEITGLIKERSLGNPFFVEEVIRSFIDEGLIEIKKNAFILTDKIKYANIPESIDKVLLSRIDRLDEKTRNLLKTASVIGRNFYFKVLEEAAHTIGELDDKLEYLKDVQLLSERKGKDEVEFLFKHALAQQATYDSIMEKTRKELHLKIARSIERVFADRLPEFYGTLAHHYTKAGVDEKVLDYLVKAGDESLRAGASSEAVKFFAEAIDRMPKSTSDKLLLDQLKELEVKRAFSLQASGANIEAIEKYEVILKKYFGHRFPKRNFTNMMSLVYNISGLIIKVNLPGLFFRKNPTRHADQYAEIYHQWGEALATLNPKRHFFQSFSIFNFAANYDLRKSVSLLSVFTASSPTFLWTGLSFGMSRKISQIALAAGVEKHHGSLMDYSYSKVMYRFFIGDLGPNKELDNIFSLGMRVGDAWPLTIYVLYTGLNQVYHGNRSGFHDCIKKLDDISESFDNSHAKAQYYRLGISGYYRYRELEKTIEFGQLGRSFISKTGHTGMLLVVLSYKAQAHLLSGQVEEARKFLEEARPLYARHKIISSYNIPYLLAEVQIQMHDLRVQPGHGVSNTNPKSIFKVLNLLIKKARKFRSVYAESYRLKAEVYRLLGKYKKAIRNYDLSVTAGIKYNTRMELARTYFAFGQCLQEPACRDASASGSGGNEYLLKARAMFDELDMKWDMERYEEYVENK